MRLATANGDCHLTYCLNIHPGESWAENFAAIRNHAVAVRQRLGLTASFGLGLRLSARAAQELGNPRSLAEFAAWLAGEGMYVFTVNGFPYGQFHGTRIKEAVYAPDWQTPERLAYTLQLADILAALLPAGVNGSISTLPGSYRKWVRTPQARQQVLLGLVRAAAGLAALAGRTGKKVQLALEPEPDCLWDTTAGMLRLFTRELAGRRLAELAALCGLTPEQAAAAVKNHLGVCVDCCHLAVNFEDVIAALETLQRRGVPVAKIQVSAAPTALVTRANLDTLECLAEPVYLHQTRVRLASGRIRKFPDLPPALAAVRGGIAEDGELRTHFHIPLGCAGWRGIRSTREILDSQFFAWLQRGSVPHLELETYTFAVLPEDLQTGGVERCLADEFSWFLANWQW